MPFVGLLKVKASGATTYGFDGISPFDLYYSCGCLGGDRRRQLALSLLETKRIALYRTTIHFR